MNVWFQRKEGPEALICDMYPQYWTTSIGGTYRCDSGPFFSVVHFFAAYSPELPELK